MNVMHEIDGQKDGIWEVIEPGVLRTRRANAAALPPPPEELS